MYNILFGKPGWTRQFLRPWNGGWIMFGWLFKEIGCDGVGWIYLAEDRVQ
jgi:hypothetical protein